MHLDEFQTLLWKMVKERSRLFCNIFFLFNCRNFQRVQISNHSLTLQDRNAQKITIWDVTCFHLNNSRSLKYLFDSNFPIVTGWAFGGTWMGKRRVIIRPLGRGFGDCGISIHSWIMICQSATCRKELAWHILHFMKFSEILQIVIVTSGAQDQYGHLEFERIRQLGTHLILYAHWVLKSEVTGIRYSESHSWRVHFYSFISKVPMIMVP